MVRDHNREVRRSRLPEPWYIRNFTKGVRRAYDSARKPRLERAAAVGSKASERYFRDLFGLDVDV